MTPIEDLLGAELHRLTDTLTPSNDPSGDLRRGRRRRHRVRLAAVVGGSSVVAVASAAAVVLLPGGNDAMPVAEDPTPTATPEPAPAPTPVTTPEGRTCLPMDRSVVGRSPALNRVVKGYREILAERLDPQGAHLDRWEVTRSVQSSGGQVGCPDGSGWVDALGTKVGWRVAGESGQGVVQVEVSDAGSWSESSLRYSHDDWRDQPVRLPGVVSAEVASYDGGTAVVVHRTDGVSVGIDANTLFGNNSLTPVSGLDVTTDQLLAAAADPRFALP